MKKTVARQILAITFCLSLGKVDAAEFEQLGKAVAKVLGTTQAYRTTIDNAGKTTEIFYSKNKKGKAAKLAVVEKGVYEPDCTHTWVVGVDAAKTTVTDVRVVEMSCPHAFPTREPSFLGQYKGKGKKSVKGLEKEVDIVAKATGSSELATKAVRSAIITAIKLKGRI